MKRFEYKITKHESQEFLQLVYFCSENGACKFDQLPDTQFKMLEEILNEKGSEGWELVQLAFARDGLVAFWKREAF